MFSHAGLMLDGPVSVTQNSGRPPGTGGARLTKLVEVFRRNESYADVALGVALLGLALFGTRVQQLQYDETLRELSEIRPTAELAASMTGEPGQGGAKLLAVLAEFPKPIRAELAYFLAVVGSLPLAFRRRLPVIVHLAVFVAFVLSMWFVPLNADVTATLFWISTYFFAAHAQLKPVLRNLVISVGSLIALLLVSTIVKNSDLDPSTVSFRDKFAAVVLNGVFFGSAIALGMLIRRYKNSLQTLQVQTETLKRQHLELERTATMNERVRIAREVHDVVAHHVSVMGMHAGAARLTLGSESSAVGTSLATIERASRDAVTDLHRLLSFLRSEDGASLDQTGNLPVDQASDLDISRPQPTLAALPSLMDNHRAAGFGVVPRISAELPAANPTIELAAYRIVQEALTNIRKHGAKSDESAIDVWSDADCLRLRIENTPTKPRPHTTAHSFAQSQAHQAGHGLRGMRERAALHGGEFDASTKDDGGFIVRAVLPLRG